MGVDFMNNLYLQLLKGILEKFILKKSNGEIVKELAEQNGVVYIKLAQILVTQNFKNFFNEEDRKILSSICDNCNPIKYTKIKEILDKEYQNKEIFSYIDPIPLGSASVSQVHKAILKTGEQVVIKVKRLDVAANIEKDIAQLRKLFNQYRKILKFNNSSGGNYALDLYLNWIEEETDFQHEIENIKIYQKFAHEVNQKLNDTKLIKIPRVYDEYCTNNIIVMEYISYPTINQEHLTLENKKRISNAINSYIKLSFWALLNDKDIVFHGDPHAGNICVDKDENIYFLDMGFLCILEKEESKLCREFFLTAYTKNYEKLYNMLIEYGQMDIKTSKRFLEQLKEYCNSLDGQDVSYYFTGMINICLNYEFVPPKFLYAMAKSFVCLNGINRTIENDISAESLIQKQIAEFIIKKNLENVQKIFLNSINDIPFILKNNLENGLIDTTLELICNNEEILKTVSDFDESLNLIKNFYNNTKNRTFSNDEKTKRKKK